MIGEVIKVMSMSSVLKASLFAIALVAAFSSLLAVSEIDTAEGAEPGTFFSEGDLEYQVITATTAEVAGFDGPTIAVLVIPSSVTHGSVTYNVTSIGDYAFYNCTGLTSLTISEGVESIGYSAFNGLTFVAEDGTTVLEHTVENLRSYRFEGTYERMVRITYTVTYDVDGGSVPEPIQSPLSEGRSFVVAAYDGTKAGYTFGGWMSDDKNIFRPGGTFTIGDMDVTLTAIWCLDVDPVADGTVEVEHSSVSFSQVDVETGKEYSFGLDNGVMARFNGSDVTGDVTFTAVQWEGDFHVEGAAVYSIDMVGSGSVNILIPVGEFGSPVVHHLRADGTDEILTSTIVEIDGVEYASFDADNFSFFYMVEGTPAEGGPMDTMLIAGAVAAVLVVVLVAFWAYRRKNAS